MATIGEFFRNLFSFNQSNNRLDEGLKQFKEKPNKDIHGEGFEDINSVTGFNTSTVSFNLFYEKEINKAFKDNVSKIKEYRKMYEMPEIGDVVENAAMEATQKDFEDNIFTLEFNDEDIEKSENIKKNLTIEFNKLFHEKIKINKAIEDWMITLLVDGKLFLENIINKNKASLGIIGVKKLPSETMDYDLDPLSGRTTAFFQFLSPDAKKPKTIEEAEKDDKVVLFFPKQITFVDSGLYGANRKDVLSYLHRCRQPFNQLRLLETSVVIYRLIRSPERLVFKIDTGNMPKDKAMKYVEKIKNKFTKKQIYDPNTGNLANSTDVTSILENYFLAQSSDGRGSEIESVGGNPSGFSELDDIKYFQKKLYRSLKYPMSRVNSMNEGRDGEIVIGTRQNEIERDEVAWARLLEKYQQRVCDQLVELFLIHLNFIGYTKQYDLDCTKLIIKMTSPNNYINRISESVEQQKFENYNAMANNQEFPKTYLMRRYLDYTDDDLNDIQKGWEEDKKYLKQEDAEF